MLSIDHLFGGWRHFKRLHKQLQREMAWKELEKIRMNKAPKWARRQSDHRVQIRHN